MATLYKTDGTVQTVQPTNGTDYTLEELQKLVGGFIQIVPANYSGDGEIVVCDEEGKIKGKPVNYTATRLWVARGDDMLVGDVLFCKDSEMK